MLYRLTISPYSSFSYPIQGDTLFGAFCWSYKYLYGTEKLEEFLHICMTGKPPIIFSNMFPYNKLPLPLAIINKLKKENDNSLKYHKDLKKLKDNYLISRETFLEVANKNYKNVLKINNTKSVTTITEVHNMVDRHYGTVNKNDDENESSNLFSIKTSFSSLKDEKFDIYILCDKDIKEYLRVLKLMFKLGIGSKKSTGKGAFAITTYSVEEDLIKNIANANAFVAISNFIPKTDDPIKGYYKVMNKFPKLDREFATSETPFKKPICMIQCSSCFYYNVKKDYYGVCLDNMSNLNKKIMINACTIALPICLDEDYN